MKNLFTWLEHFQGPIIDSLFFKLKIKNKIKYVSSKLERILLTKLTWFEIGDFCFYNTFWHFGSSMIFVKNIQKNSHFIVLWNLFNFWRKSLVEVSTMFNKHKRQCMWLLCRSITLCQNLTFMITTMLVFIIVCAIGNYIFM